MLASSCGFNNMSFMQLAQTWYETEINLCVVTAYWLYFYIFMNYERFWPLCRTFKLYELCSSPAKVNENISTFVENAAWFLSGSWWRNATNIILIWQSWLKPRFSLYVLQTTIWTILTWWSFYCYKLNKDSSFPLVYSSILTCLHAKMTHDNTPLTYC